MDVGTAKLPSDERRGVPHHLLDVLDVTERASVAVFQREARAVIADCRARGVVPVLVGGSALYTRAVLDRFEFPGTDPEVRARWERRARRASAPAALHARLAEADPAAALAVLPSNGRRIVRALEVIELTGRPFSATLPLKEYVDPAHRPGRRRRPPRDRRRAGRPARRPDVGGGPARRGPRPGGPRAARGADGRAAPSATARRWTTSTATLTARGGAGGHRAGHPPLRPPPGVVVPQGRARHLARPRRPTDSWSRRGRAYLRRRVGGA